MLPALNENGDLPPGVYLAGWNEIELRFGIGSEARKQAFVTLKHVHDLAVGTGQLKTLYVFGSFVSAALEPRNVDVVLVMKRDFKLENCPWPAIALFSHAAAEARYGATVFWFREGTLPNELLQAWQLKRDGTLRGILEVA